MSKAVDAPRAIIHQKILDAAASTPEASMEEIATNVSGASLELVERVLDEYGDPAREKPAHGSEPSESTPEADPAPAPSELTDFQLDVLRAIYETPTASQRDLAGRMDVATSTINRQVNSIDGFDWSDRETFVKGIFERVEPDQGDEPSTPNDSTPRSDLEEMSRRVTRIEERLETSDRSGSLLDDPALVHKVVRACMECDSITEDEELQIISRLLR